MTRLPPLDRESIPTELEPVLSMVESAMGFLPNSLLIMARRPSLVQAFAGLQRPSILIRICPAT